MSINRIIVFSSSRFMLITYAVFHSPIILQLTIIRHRFFNIFQDVFVSHLAASREHDAHYRALSRFSWTFHAQYMPLASTSFYATVCIPTHLAATGLWLNSLPVLANALLATLNSRIALKGRATEYSTSHESTTAAVPIPISTRPPGTRTSRILSLLQQVSVPMPHMFSALKSIAGSWHWHRA